MATGLIATKKRQKGKSIKVQVIPALKDERPIIICPELEDSDHPFRFRGMCPMTRCQYCTTVTQNGCMALDRKESAERTISNKEIAHYKKGLYPELGQQDQKQLDATVRRAQQRTRLATCLILFITKLDGDDCDKTFKFVAHRDPLVDQVHSYLAQTLPGYKPWMLGHMDDNKTFSELVGTYTQSEHNLGAALRLTPKKYQTFCTALRYLKKHSGEVNE